MRQFLETILNSENMLSSLVLLHRLAQNCENVSNDIKIRGNIYVRVQNGNSVNFVINSSKKSTFPGAKARHA
jgi:hypothetical protein